MTPAPRANTEHTDHSHPASSTSESAVVSMMVLDEAAGAQAGLQSGTNDNDSEAIATMEPGTHAELMYVLGVNLARKLGDIKPLIQDSAELSNVAKGIIDTLLGRLDEKGQQHLLTQRGKDLDDLVVGRANVLREKLEQRGREMLQRMASTKGVRVLDNNVVLHVLDQVQSGPVEINSNINPRQGIRPTRDSTVQIHYHGTLADGTVFDSTLGDENPVTVPLDVDVIPGWRDGVLAMREGETAMLGIPPEQAYGKEGTPDGRIPGGSTLFFKIQLVKVVSGGTAGGASGSDEKAVLACGNASVICVSNPSVDVKMVEEVPGAVI